MDRFNSSDPVIDLLRDTTDFSIYEEMIATNYEERILVINDEITDALLEDVCLAIFNWNRKDADIPSDKRKPIKLYINSGGGGVVFGNHLIDCIRLSKTPVHTVAMSNCCSMASYLLVAGHQRYCFPGSVILLHDGQSGVYNSSNKARDTMAFYDKLDERNKKFLMERTKLEEEFLNEIKDREYYMFAEEAKERGIIDYIVGVDCDLDDIL